MQNPANISWTGPVSYGATQVCCSWSSFGWMRTVDLHLGPGETVCSIVKPWRVRPKTGHQTCPIFDLPSGLGHPSWRCWTGFDPEPPTATFRVCQADLNFRRTLMWRVAGNGWRHLSNPAKLLDGILYRLATACGTVGWKLPESYTPIPPEFTLGNWTLVEGWERFIELTLGLTGSKKIIGVIGVSRCDLRCVHSTNLIPSHTYTKWNRRKPGFHMFHDQMSFAAPRS